MGHFKIWTAELVSEAVPETQVTLTEVFADDGFTTWAVFRPM